MTVPTFTTHRSTGWVPSSSPAASPRLPRSTSSWPPARPTLDLTEVTPTASPSTCAPLTGPDPSSSSRRSNFRGFHHWFLRTCTSPSHLTGPGHLTVPTRPAVVGAAPALTRTSGLRLPPASSGCCDNPTGKASHLPTVPWRLVAHGVGGPDFAPVRLGETAKARRSSRASRIICSTLGSCRPSIAAMVSNCCCREAPGRARCAGNAPGTFASSPQTSLPRRPA